MLICHHNDLDGRCAAHIMSLWSDEPVRFLSIDYKDSFDPCTLQLKEKIAIVDFSFKPEIMNIIAGRAERIIWCDHHKTAKDYNCSYTDGFCDFSDKGLSGCECTWKFCFPDRLFPRAVELVGDYDSWRLNEQPECFEFYEGMKLENTHPHSSVWSLLFDHSTGKVWDVIHNGRIAIKYRDNYCQEILNAFGYEASFEGMKIFCLNTARFGSKAFGVKMQEHPICAMYFHDGFKFTVSLYSDKVDIDVGDICKKYGGGGHKGAAGFVTDILPFNPCLSAKPPLPVAPDRPIK